MSETQRYARVPAEMSRAGWQRTAWHVATAGKVTGRAASVAGALADLADHLKAMAGRAYEPPRFFWDADNGGLHVVTPDPVSGGHFAYMVMFPEGRPPYLSQGTASGTAPVSEALSTAVGLDPVVTSHGRPTA